MLHKLKRIFKRRVTSEGLLQELRRRGARIGRDVHVYAPDNTIIDASCACLLSIGDHVRITDGVRILTHDYSWSVLKGYGNENIQPGAVLGARSPVEIGSHVFIGMNAIITPGVRIGDHVIIGAGSIVTKDCEPKSVYAGNPARRIMGLEEFFRRRKERQLPEARTIARNYRERFGKAPPMEVFSEYFMLFLTRAEAEKVAVFRAQMGRMGSGAETAAYMDANPPMFPGYAAFLKACYAEDEP